MNNYPACKEKINKEIAHQIKLALYTLNFVYLFSRLKVLTYINENNRQKEKNERKESSALIKMKQLYPPKALIDIYKSCCELVFLPCKTTTTFGLVTVADMLSNTI